MSGGRPRKLTVDWFPHSVDHGMTIYVLDERYGIAGYYFWFRLLEMLGKTEGHAIEFNNPARKAYLQAYTKTTPETCKEILNLLSDLEAIDTELWKKGQVIWSDNFLDGVKPAYRKREDKIPVKPSLGSRKPTSKSVSGAVILSETGEGKGREGEGREGEGRKEDIAPPGPSDQALPSAHPFFTCPYFVVDMQYRWDLAIDYPALDDKRLLLECKKMADWISDNSKKKKFKANGQLANKKLFIRNWLEKIDDIKGPGKDEPKGYDGLRKFAEKRGLGK
jgi:hypothetical protein